MSATETNRLTQESPRTDRDDEFQELLRRAKDLLKSGSFSEAEKQVRIILEKEPDSQEGHFLLGLILFKQDRATESLAEYTEGAKHHPPNAEDLKIVALDYVLLGDFKEADKWLTKSITWNPNDAEAWYHLGRTKYNENHFEEAIEAFQRCLQMEKRNVKAKSNLGLSLAGLGRSAEAQATYREAISWQAESAAKIAEPYIDLGDLLLDQNQTDEAVALLIQADAISPEDPRVSEMLGRAYWRQNKLQNAQVKLEKAVKLAPASAANHYLLGQVYRKQGMAEKARVEFDRASELSASHALPANVNH
jgi:Flp pilus assembly protein TadD